MTGNDVFVSAPEIKGTIRVNPDVFGGTNRELDFIVTGETADTNDRTLMVRSGTDIQTPSHVGLRIQAALGVNITGALLKAGNANATDEPMIIGSQTGNVTLQSSTVSGGNLEVRGSTTDNVPQKLTVDHSTLTSRHDAVIGTPTKQTIIELRNSTQLSSLVGSITVQSKGGPVMVDTSALTASKGTITLDSYDSQDPNANALVTLHNANLAADVIRVRGSSASGDALIIDGGTFNASSLIKFYGGSASTLHFINNTTLTAPTSVLAAGTVQVDGGSTVTINGSGQVFTDHANFNDGTHGTINASKGLNTQSYSGRPKF